MNNIVEVISVINDDLFSSEGKGEGVEVLGRLFSPLSSLVSLFNNESPSSELGKTVLQFLLDFYGEHAETIYYGSFRHKDRTSNSEFAIQLFDRLDAKNQLEIIHFIATSNPANGLWLKIEIFNHVVKSEQQSDVYKSELVHFSANVLKNHDLVNAIENKKQFFKNSLSILSAILNNPTATSQDKQFVASVVIDFTNVLWKHRIFVGFDDTSLDSFLIDSFLPTLSHVFENSDISIEQKTLLSQSLGNLVVMLTQLDNEDQVPHWLLALNSNLPTWLRDDRYAVAFVQGVLSQTDTIDPNLKHRATSNFVDDYEYILATYVVEIIDSIEDKGLQKGAKDSVSAKLRLSEKAVEIWNSYTILVFNATGQFSDNQMTVIEYFVKNFLSLLGQNNPLKVITARSSSEEPVDIPEGVLGFTLQEDPGPKRGAFDLKNGWGGAIAIVPDHFLLGNPQELMGTLVHEFIHVFHTQRMEPLAQAEINDIFRRANSPGNRFIYKGRELERDRGFEYSDRLFVNSDWMGTEMLAYTGASPNSRNGWFRDSVWFLDSQDPHNELNNDPMNNHRIQLATVFLNWFSYKDEAGQEHSKMFKINEDGSLQVFDVRIERDEAGRIIAIEYANKRWELTWERDPQFGLYVVVQITSRLI